MAKHLPIDGEQIAHAAKELIAQHGDSAFDLKDRSDSLPHQPVIVLDGNFNALSAARSLGQAGIKVYSLNYRHSRIRYSRFCQFIRLDGTDFGPEAWEAFLLGGESDYLRGAIILTCGDEAIEIIIRSGARLREKFILEEIDTEVRECLLDKLTMYEKAKEIDVPVPHYWQVRSISELDALESEFVFPLLLKPRFSHKFRKVWKQKHFRADTMSAARGYFTRTVEHLIDVLVMESIPGDDSNSCSYHVYMDEHGVPLAELTKRCVRRYPANMGSETFGFTDRNPELRDLAVHFFRHVALRGPANIEFKRDERDGRLKLIEVNARFTAPNCLVTASGIDLVLLAYSRLTRYPDFAYVPCSTYKEGLRWWLPVDDFRAFLALRRRGELTLWRWLSQVLRPHVLPSFRWNDPLPTIAAEGRRALGFISNLFRTRS